MRRTLSILLVGLFLLQSTACYSWRAESEPAAALAAAKPQQTYRLHLANGKTIEITGVVVRGDSLRGLTDSATFARGEIQDARVGRAVPLADITALERHQINVVGTAVLVAVCAATALAIKGLERFGSRPLF